MSDERNLKEGIAEKELGMLRAATNRRLVLVAAQQIAENLASQLKRPISIDDVKDQMRRETWVTSLGNAAGSVFKGKMWKPAGFVQSQYKSAHARIVRLWELTE